MPRFRSGAPVERRRRDHQLIASNPLRNSSSAPGHASNHSPLGSAGAICKAPGAVTNLRSHLAFALVLIAGAVCLTAQEAAVEDIKINSDGEAVYDFERNIATVTSNVVIRYRGAVLTSDRAVVNEETGDVSATGHVRLQQDAMVWTGDHVQYNFYTQQMSSDRFRAGRAPVFMMGRGLHGDLTNGVYTATNALITTEDIWRPMIGIRAKNLRIYPGKKVEATHATLYAAGTPIFYFPFYVRNIGPNANNLNVTPGYRSRYGAYLLGTYTWIANEHFDGEFHLDYRQLRGVGAGPDVNFHFGRWGNGSLSYYYTHDDNPRTNAMFAPVFENRQRFKFTYQANPYTNLNVKSVVRYQNDPGVVRDFFEGEYRHNPQPNTFVEVNRFWQNFSLDVLAQPRVNDFYETVERLPDVRLSGFRQQIGESPLFYESESSVGYYRRLFANTNNAPSGLSFEAGRADTYHQVTLPRTFFGWLNFTPRVGGRLTYYTEANGPGEGSAAAGLNDGDAGRGVFNTGAELSFKASRVWQGVRSSLLDVDGLRHIVVPSANYVYVPTPNYRPSDLPKFDYELPSLRILPVDFPEYNSIDSVDSQNVIRFGLGNRLQTKRGGEVSELLNWQVYTDWRLRPETTEAPQYRNTFSDIYSDVTVRPRKWLALQSQTRYDIDEKEWTMSLHNLAIQPNDTWSFSVGHFYLRPDRPNAPTWLGEGNNLMNTTLYYRVNENWGFRANHYYDVRDGQLREQFYTAYRDLRSWTCALTVGMRNEVGRQDDFLVAFTFSLKAAPRYGIGADTIERRSLLGR